MSDKQLVNACLRIAKGHQNRYKTGKAYEKLVEMGYAKQCGDYVEVSLKQRHFIRLYLENTWGIIYKETFTKEDLDTRIKAALKGVNEKFNQGSISHKLVKIKPLTGHIRIDGVQLPALKNSHYEAYPDNVLIAPGSTVIMIENYEAFLHANCIVDAVASKSDNVVCVYRGDPQTESGVVFVRHVKSVMSDIEVGVYADCDPAGVEIALSPSPDFVIMPDLDHLNQLINQSQIHVKREDFMNQHTQYLIYRDKLDSHHPMRPYLDLIGKIKAGISQEHLIASACRYIRLNLK